MGGVRVHECRDGPPRATDAPGFERERNREEKRHRRRLEPLPDPGGPCDGDRHEQVHIGPEALGGEPRLGQDVPRTGEDPQGIQTLRDERHLVGRAQAFGTQRRSPSSRHPHMEQQATQAENAARPGQDCTPAALPASGFLADRPLGTVHLGPQPRAGHCLEDCFNADRKGTRGNPHRAVQKIEGEPVFTAYDRADRAFEGGDLLGAVHAVDSET